MSEVSHRYHRIANRTLHEHDDRDDVDNGLLGLSWLTADFPPQCDSNAYTDYSYNLDCPTML